MSVAAMVEPSMTDVLEARRRIRNEIFPVTPRLSDSLSEIARREVWLIPECLQRTGSFKFRGALNRMIMHSDHGGAPVITASSGNHAIGMTVAARLTGVQATVVVPEGASEAKLEQLRLMGADVLEMGTGFDEAENMMFAYAESHGLEIVNSFDRDVIAGHGTALLDALRHVPDLGVLLAPVASGGLLAGCAIVAQALAPACQIIGVQSEAWPAMDRSLRSGELTMVTGAETVADGLAGNAMRSTLPFQIIQRQVADVLLVDELPLLRGIRHALLRERLVVEGAGAATIAAILDRQPLPGEGPVGLILSGGNCTESALREALDT
ncbi:MAG: pyridoxal-phosphate dependent enzyme [Thermomicrobiaceae bacterium]